MSELSKKFDFKTPFERTVFFILFVTLASITSADTITLKSGDIIEGDIVTQAEDFVKIDTGAGVSTTYYLDEIESLDGRELQSKSESKFWDKEISVNPIMYLSDGSIAYGKILEKNNRYVKIDFPDNKNGGQIIIRYLLENPYPNSKAGAFFDQSMRSILEGEHASGMESLKKAIDLNPEFRSALFNIGVAYWLGPKESKDKAIRYWQKALLSDNKFAEGYCYSGFIAIGMKEIEKAEKAIKLCLDLDPSITEAYGYLGTAYLLSKNCGQAIEPLKKAITYYPNNAIHYLTLGSCLAGLGDLDSAKPNLEKAVQLFKQENGNPNVINSLEKKIEKLY